MIRRVLSEDNYDLKGRIDSRVGSGYSDYYNLLIGSVWHNLDKVLQYRTQYLTYEYCKSSDVNARSKVDRYDLFEAKWFFVR